MNIGNSVDFYVDRSFSARVGRGNNSSVDIDIDVESGSGDDDVVELKVVDGVGYGDDNIVDKVFKYFKVGVSVGVGDSVGWGVDKFVSVDIVDGITFELNDESNMVSSGLYIDGFNNVKTVDLLQNK